MTDQREEDSSNLFKQNVYFIPTAEWQYININQNNGFHFYEQFKKIYETSYHLFQEINKLKKTQLGIIQKLNKLQKKTQQFQEGIVKQDRLKRKRSRRTAEQIQRKYQCDVEYCGKCYGSDGSLQQHIKLKHPQLYVPKSYDQF